MEQNLQNLQLPVSIWKIIGASAASPTLVDKTRICLFIYLYVYIYGTCVFRICILPYLCVMQYFHYVSYMSKDIAKLATFESQKEVCTTHLRIRRKKERKAKA